MVVITNADGTPILQYELPRSSNMLTLFFSSSDLLAGQSYSVYTGGSLTDSTDNWNGWFCEGTYIEGTLLGTFTSSSLTTTVGHGGGPGGAGGPGGPGNGNGGMGPGWWG